ncbi:MAG: hypothetical protein K1X75_11175 [Leptospirales bacterium]|nr:hypothetical protein [Leptospirales bacterium]
MKACSIALSIFLLLSSGCSASLQAWQLQRETEELARRFDRATVEKIEILSGECQARAHFDWRRSDVQDAYLIPNNAEQLRELNMLDESLALQALLAQARRAEEWRFDTLALLSASQTPEGFARIVAFEAPPPQGIVPCTLLQLAGAPEAQQALRGESALGPRERDAFGYTQSAAAPLNAAPHSTTPALLRIHALYRRLAALNARVVSRAH